MRQEKEITTEVFRISHARFFRLMLRQKGTPYLWILAILLIISLISSLLFGLEYAILPLLIIFIIAPMLAAWLYFSEGLRPENIINILPHTLTFRPGEILATTYVEQPSDTTPAAVSITPRKVRNQIPIPPDTRYFLINDGVIFPISMPKKGSKQNSGSKKSGVGMLILPLSAFENVQTMRTALDLIYCKSEVE